MSIPFIPDDFNVPLKLNSDLFRFEPVGPQHNERDHVAWMSSIEHIRDTPGFPSGSWPAEMSLSKNLEDLKRHAVDFALRQGFTYSVLEGEEVIGAVYIYPTKNDAYDARVKSWVVASRSNLDIVLWRAVSKWLVEDWPFIRIQYDSR